MSYDTKAARRRANRNAFNHNYVERDGGLVYIGKPRKKRMRAAPKPEPVTPTQCASEEPIKLTNAMVWFGCTPRGSFRPVSIKQLGVEMRHGWLRKLPGRVVQYRNWCRFVYLNRGVWPTADDVLNLTSQPTPMTHSR